MSRLYAALLAHHAANVNRANPPQVPSKPAPTSQTGVETPNPVLSDTPPILCPQNPVSHHHVRSPK